MNCMLLLNAGFARVSGIIEYIGSQGVGASRSMKDASSTDVIKRGVVLGLGAALAVLAGDARADGLYSSTPLANSVVGSVSDGVATLPYRLYEPTGVSTGQKLPLVLYLHGMGERGTDNALQTYNMGNLLAHTQSGQYASYILAPQINTSQWFASASANPSEAMKLTLEALHGVIDTANVDTSRIYVTGVSMGGMGTWDAIRREPGTFAAAVPMSGGYDPSTASSMKDVPVWAFHGDADTLVPVQSTRDMVSALSAAGGDVRYTEIAGGEHAIWDGVYADASSTLYPWLFSQSKSSEQVVVAGSEFGADSPAAMSGEGSIIPTPVPEPSVIGLGLILGAGTLMMRSRRTVQVA